MNQSNKNKENLLNLSYDFIAPMIQGGRGILNSPNLINSFTSCPINYPFNVIFLLYEANSSDDLIKIEKLVKTSPNYLESFDLENNRVLYSFEIPDTLHQDYYKILEGKYSQTSEDYKRLIPKYDYFKDDKGGYLKDDKGNLIKELSIVHCIVNREPDFIEDWSNILNIPIEVFEDLELYDKIDFSTEELICEIIDF